jgi:hypothetical protein
LALLLGTVVLLPLAGCKSCDLVEAELRTKERQVRELKDDLYRTELYNEALQNELRDLRHHTATALSPEQASQTYTLKEVVLGRGTGGYDDDGKPGDEALQVVLEPRDPDGHAIKAPGSLHVEAVQINSQGLKMPLSFWEITPEQLRRTWRSGLLSTGYHLVLPWKVWPSEPKLRITARFTLADGRVFEADKDITVRLAPEALRKSGPVVGPEVLPLEPDVLPAPRETPPRMPPANGDALWPAEKRDAFKPASWQRPAPTVPLMGAVHLLQPAPASEAR